MALIYLQNFFFQTESKHLRESVPQTWKRLNDQPFDKETMRLLSVEGRHLGGDPNSWMTEAP
jgi:hypothetical protein